jgi:hypothetical protein
MVAAEICEEIAEKLQMPAIENKCPPEDSRVQLVD